MIELKNHFGSEQSCLQVSFPEVSADPVLTISFQRTLRIPDDGREYPLPPGLGTFPLRHIDDHAERVPAGWLERGGVLLPMYQSEALWLSFRSNYIRSREADYPFAVKIATGKINAVTGESWREGLSGKPQNYLVAPTQPWLDGYCVEKGIIRQFVAMPLGDGYSAEEQLTGKAETGGLQIEVYPMRKAVFEKRFPKVEPRLRSHLLGLCEMASGMGLAPGGRMRQEIYKDPYSITDWDTEHRSRCFIHIVNSLTWKRITGENPPITPISAKEYTSHGMPWFDYYDGEARALNGGEAFGGMKSVVRLSREKRRPVKDNESIEVGKILKLRAALPRDQVREGTSF